MTERSGKKLIPLIVKGARQGKGRLYVFISGYDR